MPAFAGMTIFSSLEGLPRGFSEFWQILSAPARPPIFAVLLFALVKKNPMLDDRGDQPRTSSPWSKELAARGIRMTGAAASR